MVDNSHNNGKISRRAIFLFPTDNLVYNDHCLLTVREKQEDSKKATFHICCARTIFQRHFLSVQAIQRPCRTFYPAYFTFIFDSINYSLRAVSSPQYGRSRQARTPSKSGCTRLSRLHAG